MNLNELLEKIAEVGKSAGFMGQLGQGIGSAISNAGSGLFKSLGVKMPDSSGAKTPAAPAAPIAKPGYKSPGGVSEPLYTPGKQQPNFGLGAAPTPGMKPTESYKPGSPLYSGKPTINPLGTGGF